METIKTKEIGSTEIIKEVNRDEMVITHYISTRTPDRYDEVMNPKGCDDTEYRKNPVVFFGHRARDLPIAKNIKLTADDYGVIAVTKFDSSEFAKEVFRLNTEGFLNSWSIGFVPMEQPEVKDKYLFFERWKLLEYSSVPIPANPDAVNLMLKEVRDEKVKKIIGIETKKLILMDEVKEIRNNGIKELTESISDKCDEEWIRKKIQEKINSKFEDRFMELIKSIIEDTTKHKTAEEEKIFILETVQDIMQRDMRVFEDRLVRKLQTLINNKTF